MFRLLGALLLLSAPALAVGGRYDAAGAGEVRYRITKTAAGWDILVLGAGVDRPDQAIFVALGTKPGAGSPLLPGVRGKTGSAVWLPFSADLLLVANRRSDREDNYVQRWEGTRWGSLQAAGDEFAVSSEPAQVLLRVPGKLTGRGPVMDIVIYLKDLAVAEGWGRLYGAIDATAPSGTGVQTIRHYLVAETGDAGTSFRRAGRTEPADPKVRIYQLLPRLFGNTNETRKPNGTVAENGSGKFSDLNETALAELKTMGFTHIWVTGVLQQATATDYGSIGEPADDPDLLKGVAGSPYAIRDYFDVSPDYADHPGKRMEEFKALVARAHASGFKILIDFVPNHVARSYASTAGTAVSFGAKDNPAKFFDPKNNFYYLADGVEAEGDGPPLRLPTVDGDGRATSPTVQAVGGGDGSFDREREFGRVTGNNVISWNPPPDSWYETVKLNYGYDFTDPEKSTRLYPHGAKPDLAVPDTWKKMDEIIAYWQDLGVDGFRADMAQMVPPEFWRWLIGRSHLRRPDVYWVAEAYDTDPARVPGGDPEVIAVTEGAVMPELLAAGFDAVYDDVSYDALKNIYEGRGTANDLDTCRPGPFFFDNALRYAENHDEVRLAAVSQWGGHGMDVGRPLSALLFGLSRGPVMLYHGQEVGEPGAGAEGFGRDDARTTIYDYWSMPEFVKWVNGGKFDGGGLSMRQKSLRDFYRRLLSAIDQPAFREGDFYPLNPDNLANPAYGRSEGGVSGHWLYSYLRYDQNSGQRVLVVVNLHPRLPLRDVHIIFPRRAMRFLGWDTLAGSETVPVVARDLLGEVPGEVAEIATTPARMEKPGLLIKELQPMAAAYYDLYSGAGRATP
ncbi:MAG: alpha-amylase family glycosyl hydrolase [Verrucomicrobia bacterium]|jgi:glycosidase|nr:alpha-amylase family glycosyl hydrolase [Verrucomicrobiota bacterium]MDA1203530.1 alpha-amylase family glycosyl hydrolase [Verrucomicrobiota bacterium]